MQKAKKPSKRAPKKEVDARLLYEEIRERAYHISLERGDKQGDPMSDWLQAEQEILKKYNLSP